MRPKSFENIPLYNCRRYLIPVYCHFNKFTLPRRWHNVSIEDISSLRYIGSTLYRSYMLNPEQCHLHINRRFCNCLQESCVRSWSSDGEKHEAFWVNVTDPRNWKGSCIKSLFDWRIINNVNADGMRMSNVEPQSWSDLGLVGSWYFKLICSGQVNWF